MCSQFCYGVGLNIGGQIGFNINLLFGEKIYQRLIFNGFYVMFNMFCIQFMNCLLDVFWFGSFVCMDGNMLVCIMCVVEVRKEQIFWKIKFIIG